MEIELISPELINETLTPMIVKKQWSKIKDYLNSFKRDVDNQKHYIVNADSDDYCDEAIDNHLYLKEDNYNLKSSRYLSFSDLAGLINATESLFFTSQSMVYNCLNFKHKDFIKNYNHFLDTEFSPTLLRDILITNADSKNDQHKKNNFLAIMNSLHCENQLIEEDIFTVILKHKDYLHYALEAGIVNVSENYATKQKLIKSTLLHKAVTYGSMESIEFLLDNYQWDLNQKREDGIDLFYSSIMYPQKYYASKILDLLLTKNPQYDFSNTYCPSLDSEVHYISQTMNHESSYNLTQIINIEKQKTKDSTEFDDYKEHQLKSYDAILMVIEKYQFEQSLNTQVDKKTKNKI
jgi:hypothetical protein